MGSATRAWATGMLLAGCSGVIGDPAADRSGARAGTAAVSYAPAGLRVLTPAQFEDGLRAVLGPDTPTHPVGEWRSSLAAAQGGISLTSVEDYETAVRSAAEFVFRDPVRRQARAECTPRAVAGDTCIRGLLGSLGRRAWRRSLTAAELDRYGRLAAEAGVAFGDPWRGVELAVTGLLQSPHFLYRVELGEPDPARDDRLRFSSVEMASRLSYLLWNATPDDALLDAGESGALTSLDGLTHEVDRLLASDRAREGLLRFYTEWLDLDALLALQKDASVLPRFTATLGPALREQLLRTIDTVALAPGGSHLDLLDGRSTFVNRELADLYGLPGERGDALEPVTFPPDGPRAGLLTWGGLLAIHAGETDTSPTLRGKFVRTILLCDSIPPPPPGVVTVLPEPASGELVTKRELLSRHRDEPTCASCHSRMDPIGFALENFDALGVYRETENEIPIDPSGDIDGASFADARGLGRVLRDHERTPECLVRNLYRFAAAHVEGEGQAEAIEALTRAFVDGGVQVRELARALAASDLVRFAAPPPDDAAEETP